MSNTKEQRKRTQYIYLVLGIVFEPLDPAMPEDGSFHLCDSPRNPSWLKSVAVELLFLGNTEKHRWHKAEVLCLSQRLNQIWIRLLPSQSSVLPILLKCDIYCTYISLIYIYIGKECVQIISIQLKKLTQIEHTCILSPRDPLHLLPSPPSKGNSPHC